MPSWAIALRQQRRERVNVFDWLNTLKNKSSTKMFDWTNCKDNTIRGKMFDWLTTEVWDGIREWREFIRSLLYLDHRDHLCYITSFTLHGIGIGIYFVEER